MNARAEITTTFDALSARMAEKTKLRPWPSGNEDVQFTTYGIWRLYLARQTQFVIFGISMFMTFGAIYYASISENTNYIYAAIIALTPSLLGVIFACMSSFVILALREVTRRNGSSQRVFTVPLILAPLFAAPIVMVIHVVALQLFLPQLQLSLARALLSALFTIVAMEVVLRFIITTIVPAELAKLPPETHLRVTGKLPKTVLSGESPPKPPVEAVVAPLPAVEKEMALAKTDPVMASIGNHAILQRDILMLEAQGNYVNVVTPDRNFLVRGPLNTVLQENATLEGIQVHRSRWISTNSCRMLEKRGADLFVHLQNDDQVKVVRARHTEVREFFQSNKLTDK